MKIGWWWWWGEEEEEEEGLSFTSEGGDGAILSGTHLICLDGKATHDR